MNKLLALFVVLLMPIAASAAIDGLGIQSDFCPGGVQGCSALMQVQNNHTGFGDTFPPSGGFSEGSEMDELYVFASAGSLALNITGNLEDNGNFWMIFLDTASGGQNTLSIANEDIHWAVRSLTGTKFDAGFEPDYIIAMNVWDGTLYVDLVNLQTDTKEYLGSIAFGTDGELAGGTVAGTVVGFDNTNSSGVTSDNTRDAAQQMLDAATASKGLEMLINLSAVGLDQSVSSIKLMTLLASNGGYLSNQFLPGIGGGGQKDNLGMAPVDLSSADVAPGNQFAQVTLVQKTASAPDGENIPADSGSATLAATQNNFTQFGDSNSAGEAGSSGSELDALFLSNTAAALQMGITGNLEANGNFYAIFLETGPGGVSVLSVPEGAGPMSGVLTALNGTAFDGGFSPTHVLFVNAGSESSGQFAYVDLFDLRTNTGRYVGKVAVGSGASTLEEGDNPNGLALAFDNSNAVGVTGDAVKTPAENETDAKTADTGLEALIPFADIGLAQTTIRYMVVLTGNKGYFSNQFLPGLGGGYSNLGDPPKDINLLAGLQYGTYTVTGLTYPTFDTVSSVKSQPDGTAARITAVVTWVLADSDEFYIQSGPPGDASGILVRGGAAGLSVGQTATVSGLLGRYFGERVLHAADVVPGAAAQEPEPFVVTNRSLGGAGVGDNPGISGEALGFGANNVGLLMKSCGKVTGMAYDDLGYPFFYMNDGTNLNDGNIFGYTGVRVEMMQWMMAPATDTFVSVTGVSSIYRPETQHNRRLRVRSDADIVTVAP